MTGLEPNSMRVKIAILVAAALIPFVLSCLPGGYIVLVYSAPFTFPVSMGVA